MANVGQVCKRCETYLVLYGSGKLTPTYTNEHNTGRMFELTAKARHQINKQDYPEAQHKIFYCPTDLDFFN